MKPVHWKDVGAGTTTLFATYEDKVCHSWSSA